LTAPFLLAVKVELCKS